MTRPLQVYLEEEELAKLEAFARERGWTKSQAVRLAVRALTRQRATDALLELSGDIDGLSPDLSEQFDRSLSETYIAEPRAQYRTGRRTRTPPRSTVRR